MKNIKELNNKTNQSLETFMVCFGYDIEIKYDLKFICLFFRPNFLRIFFRWKLTVVSDIARISEISLLLFPSLIKATTFISRGVRIIWAFENSWRSEEIISFRWFSMISTSVLFLGFRSASYRRPWAKLSTGIQMMKRLFDNAFFLEFFSQVFNTTTVNTEVWVADSGGWTNVNNTFRRD